MASHKTDINNYFKKYIKHVCFAEGNTVKTKLCKEMRKISKDAKKIIFQKQ